MSIPSFVKPGETLTYAAVQALGTIIFKVLSNSGTSVNEQVTEIEDNNLFESTTTDVTVTPGSSTNVGAQFWVDPNNPTGSIVGPEGEHYTKSALTVEIDGITADSIGFENTITNAFGTFPTETGFIDYVPSTGLILKEGIDYYEVVGDQQILLDSSTLLFESASPAISSTPSAPVTAPETAQDDFSGAGVSDMLWRNSNGTLAEWLMNGATIEASQAPTSQGAVVTPDSSWSVAGIGDFNGAGAYDVLWRQASTGSVVIWFMDGSKIALSHAVTSGGNVVAPDASWNVVGVGDFNGDGKADILWRQDDGPIIDWTMNGSNIASSAELTYQGSVVVPDSSWSIAGIGDFTGNGKSDILWRQASTGTLAEWSMNGSTIVSSQTLSAAPDSTWNLLGIGDFTGNGDCDMLWRQSTTNTLVEWWMNGSQISASKAITYQGNVVAPDASWNVVAIGDFNGDGKSDIIWQQTSTGDLVEWQMNGAQITPSASITFQGTAVAPPGGWQSVAKPTDFV